MFGESILKRKKLVNNPGDYQVDGLWYCGKCHTQKQMRMSDGYIACCMCECESLARKQRDEKSRINQFIMANRDLIDQEFRHMTFADAYPNQEKYVNMLKKYIDNFDSGFNFKKEGIGLFIYGEVGNGKTMLAKMLATEMLQRGHSVVMMSIQSAVEKISKFDSSKEFTQKIKDCELLILDDLGAESQTDYVKSKVAEIINARYQVNLPLVVTTNLTRQELLPNNKGNMSLDLKRSYNRLIEMTHQMFIEEHGYRIKKAQDRFNEINNILK